jgi:hypothetical protein
MRNEVARKYPDIKVDWAQISRMRFIRNMVYTLDKKPPMSYNTLEDYIHQGDWAMYSLRTEMSKAIKQEPLLGLDEYLNNLLIIVQKAIFTVDLKRFERFTLVDLVTDAGFTFSWRSKSTESACPRCGTISKHQRHTYKSRIVIDEEILGKPVVHALQMKQYICDHCNDCGAERASFVEDVSMICRPYLKTTNALDEKIVNDGICRSAKGLAREYGGRINVSRDTILRRVKEAGGMVTEKRLTETADITALSVDDNNGRKGNPSTACTVVIDAETHKILVVAQGATSGVAKKVFDRFPAATILSRDRACAYSKAGDECSLEQIADIFHLIQNAHDAVKNGLSKELRHNIYLREGDGWVELPTNHCVPDSKSLVSVSTLTEDDITERVRIAHLSARQELKYRKVIGLLKLYDEGLDKSEITRRLGLPWAELCMLLGDADDVINTVEDKIDDYLTNLVNRRCRQKTIKKNGKPSCESIVAPYSAIVMRMVSEGHTHRTIHPVISEAGFKGSANTIYQYILKKRHEESSPNTGESILSEQDSAPESVPQRPKKISLQRVAKGNLYKYVLHEAAVGRGNIEDKEVCAEVTLKAGLADSETIEKLEAPKSETITVTVAQPSESSHVSSVFYSDEVADIIHRQITRIDEEDKKKP